MLFYNKSTNSIVTLDLEAKRGREYRLHKCLDFNDSSKDSFQEKLISPGVVLVYLVKLSLSFISFRIAGPELVFISARLSIPLC